MKLKSIKIEHFRGILKLELPIDDPLTVIVGNNGIGKTSILDAIAYCLVGLRGLWPTQPGVHHPPPAVRSSDVAHSHADFSLKPSVSLSDISCEASKNTLEICNNQNSTIQSMVKLSNLARNNPVQSAEPLFVYYRQSRGFMSNGHNHSEDVISEDHVRKESLSETLNAIQNLSKWWDMLDAAEARRHRDEEHGYRDPQLHAIRQLIAEMDEFEDIMFKSKSEQPGLYLRKTGGLDIHVNQLSSGERVYLILLADLARRLQVIKPDAKLEDIPGIVLIDEIELNLHPDWQRRIISTLTRIFKSCQFIITTHSPQVLGEVHGKQIRILSKNNESGIELLESPPSRGRDSNEILIGILGATEKNEDIKNELEKLEELISAGHLKEAREKIQQLQSQIEGRPVDLEIAEQRLRRRESASSK